MQQSNAGFSLWLLEEDIIEEPMEGINPDTIPVKEWGLKPGEEFMNEDDFAKIYMKGIFQCA